MEKIDVNRRTCVEYVKHLEFWVVGQRKHVFKKIFFDQIEALLGSFLNSIESRKKN